MLTGVFEMDNSPDERRDLPGRRKDDRRVAQDPAYDGPERRKGDRRKTERRTY
jgi:hypothetical protein